MIQLTDSTRAAMARIAEAPPTSEQHRTMSNNYRATPEQWEKIKRLAKDGYSTNSAVYGFRARVEALEAALLGLSSTVSQAGNDHEQRIKALEARPTPPMAEVEPEPADEPAPVPTDEDLRSIARGPEDLIDRLRAVYDLGRQHGAAQATCPHIAGGDEGTSYCRLAEQEVRSALSYGKTDEQLRQDRAAEAGKAAADAGIEAALSARSAPPPADSLLGRVHSCIVGEPACGHMQARAVIREVAAWLRAQDLPTGHAWAMRLEQESNR